MFMFIESDCFCWKKCFLCICYMFFDYVIGIVTSMLEVIFCICIRSSFSFVLDSSILFAVVFACTVG